MLLLLLLTQHSEASQSEAINKATEAAYIQSGLKDNLEHYAKEIERKYIPVVVIDNSGVIMFIVDTLTNDQIRIKYKWSF